jgi:hypothetical protein
MYCTSEEVLPDQVLYELRVATLVSPEIGDFSRSAPRGACRPLDVLGIQILELP